MEVTLKQQYRISSWRFDVRRHTYSTPEFEGETVEECDTKAVEHFKSVSEKPENQWEGMDIVRIDVAAVAEKVTLLKINDRQQSNDEYSL